MPGRVEIICKASMQFLAELNTELKNFMFARLEGLRKGRGGQEERIEGPKVAQKGSKDLEEFS